MSVHDPVKTAVANTMWGGRFAGGPSAIMAEINASIGFDQKMWRQDLAGSRAHCRMLVKSGILSEEDGTQILEGLDQVAEELAEGRFEFSTALEDIHMNVENRLRELIGPVAGRLHTARSRNDQVATDFKLWVRDAYDRLDQALKRLQEVLIELAEDHTETVMPGYTHLQVAQPVTFAHHLLAYVEMLGRDRSRVADGRARMNESPLGAAALAGTPFPIDREMTAEELGFHGPMPNSLDAVSDRDFALDYMATGSILAMHLSRLAEEIVLWCSAGFGFVRLSDKFTTGSSIMPQKRNPDAAELMRAKPGRIFGHLIGLLTVMKGLPLTYSKDMQEDKEPVFEVDTTLGLCLAAMIGMVEDMEPVPDAMRNATQAGHPTATDLADWLVREIGVPFREAHHITGSVVAAADARGVDLATLPLEVLVDIDPRITADALKVLSVDESVAARRSFGGTAPERVRQALATARIRFLED